MPYRLHSSSPSSVLRTTPASPLFQIHPPGRRSRGSNATHSMPHLRFGIRPRVPPSSCPALTISGGRGRGEEEMEGEARGGGSKGEEGEGNVSSVSKTPSCCALHHRRSKSASDGNLDVPEHGALHHMGEDNSQSQDLWHNIDSHGTHVTNHQECSNNMIGTSPQHRASLENDVKQLQLHLNQERSFRYMLNRAIGRASSTLSPGHGHFSAQTRELIAEIELLEEEIANREQHVLSLYRNIFDQCLSAPSSSQSSNIASPAYAKKGARKHPSIISSAFCSPKMFPLQPFHILASVKKSRTNKVLFQSKNKNQSSRKMDVHPGSVCSDPRKLPNDGRSYLTRTLKEHLYRCPNDISEEMVRLMASIFCWLRSDMLEKSYQEAPKKTRAPFLSRSSTSVFLPRRGSGDDYTLPGRSTVEISLMSANKNRPTDASYAISSYRLLVEQLEKVDVGPLERCAKLAFWINIYNCLIMHAYLAYGIPNSSLRRAVLFRKAAYNVGGCIVTANSIEHSLLCCHTPRSGRWIEAILSTAMRNKCGEEKLLLGSKFGLPECQPLVLFALCAGAASDPMLRVYTAKNIAEELEKAKKEFLGANVIVKKSKKVHLPKTVDRYAKEAALGSDEILAWVSENVDSKLRGAIEKCLDSNNKRKTSQIIEWLPYDSRFSYALVNNLTETPCWL